ncbi:MAG: hypothetical protein U1E76_12080 [Planctomycetota bacterium]
MTSVLLAVCSVAMSARGDGAQVSAAHAPFPNFESGAVRPLLLANDGSELYVLNTADARLEIYATRVRATGASPGGAAVPGGAGPHAGIDVALQLEASVFTGLEPVAMALLPDDRNILFVANHLSDSVSVVDLGKRQVIATIPVGDEPQGLAVANGRLFVACARAPVVPPAPGQLDPGPFVNNAVVVAAATPPYAFLGNVPLEQLEPRDVIAVGATVYVVAQNSGNHTTLLNEVDANQLGLHQEVPDAYDGAFDINPILLLPELNESGLARGWYIPSAGRIVLDSEYPTRVPQLADRDVLAIDAATLQVLPQATSGVGTTLYSIARHPNSGDLWVALTQANNRTRFERRLRGAAIDNRVAIVAPGGAVQQVLDLAPPLLPEPCATPVAVAFSARHDLAYVAMLSSERVIVLDATQHTLVSEIATGPLPSGLAVDDARELLYVFCRGDLTLRAYAIADHHAPLAPARALAYDPEPASVSRGRMHLYDARAASQHGNGSMACASCHVFGHDDQLAWDLSDPEGSLAYYYPDVMTDLAGYPGQIVVLPTTPIQNPFKGPMVTQSLRGLMDPETKDALPLHWRGDRRTFHAFRGAFENLLDGGGLTPTQMQEFATFVRSIRYPPNPYEPRDRIYTGMVAQGADKFGMNAAFEGKEIAAGTGVSCIDCHKGNFFDRTDFTGTRPTASGGAFQQIFNTGQLRQIYEKDFRDLAGFGLLHDGAVDGVRGFMDFVKPDSGLPVFPNFTDEDKDQIATFVKHWDSGLSPLVGVQFTLDQQSVANADAFLTLAEAQAMGQGASIDLILHGFRIDQNGAVLARGGWWRDDAGRGKWGYQIDTGDLVDRATLLLVASLGIATFTFTCVPPGLGERLGVDRDEDGVFDAIERSLGTSAERADTDGDGYTDASELLLGGDPLRADVYLPDALAPTITQLRALEVSVDTATLSLAADEPVTVIATLGSAPGAGDLGTFTADQPRQAHDLVVASLPAATLVFFQVTASDHNGNAATAQGTFRTAADAARCRHRAHQQRHRAVPGRGAGAGGGSPRHARERRAGARPVRRRSRRAAMGARCAHRPGRRRGVHAAAVHAHGHDHGRLQPGVRGICGSQRPLLRRLRWRRADVLLRSACEPRPLPHGGRLIPAAGVLRAAEVWSDAPGRARAAGLARPCLRARDDLRLVPRRAARGCARGDDRRGASRRRVPAAPCIAHRGRRLARRGARHPAMGSTRLPRRQGRPAGQSLVRLGVGGDHRSAAPAPAASVLARLIARRSRDAERRRGSVRAHRHLRHRPSRISQLARPGSSRSRVPGRLVHRGRQCRRANRSHSSSARARMQRCRTWGSPATVRPANASCSNATRSPVDRAPSSGRSRR